MLILRLIIGLIAGGWLYFDAKKRNYDTKTTYLWSGGAALLGIAMPQFLFIYIAFYYWRSRKGMMPSKKPTAIDIEATVVDDSIVKINCPMCASKVQENQAACPHCGYTLVPKCPKCGKEINREWKVCPHCQTPAMPK